ncbi:MAG: DUF4954 family protein, partial [Mariniphaga sp.]|nr:DUF4954 family protein [Mariniphaga sp.]
VGDNVFISNASAVSNYDIGDNTVIENTGTLIVAGETTFGNGHEIEVLNEGGGRELPIFDKLSAQIAYLLVIYRHDKLLIEKLETIISKYAESKKSKRGTIGCNVTIRNTVSIKNVIIGDSAVIEGALNLEEGTIRSCPEAPPMIGEGVIAKNFIILSGSKIDTGAIITSTFVGQGVQIGKQFSAEGSAFFANCEAFHGEACSLFAGPYTVTHHKSTLLIAGMFSFFNAGSGTNQSNHMYKLGPLHQGIVERGSKTGSFSYLLWPCRVGPFSVVMDKHSANFDTSDLPFSYITVENGKSTITPAMNLFTVGTRRDSVKWQKRDRRKSEEKIDLINFEFLNPYLIEKVLNGSKILQDFSENTPREKEYVFYKGIHILRLMLRTTRKFYEMLIKIYMAGEIVKRIGDQAALTSFNQIKDKLEPTSEEGKGSWVDISGMFVSKEILENILVKIRTDRINSVQLLQDSLCNAFNEYENLAWNWCAALIEQRFEIGIKNLLPEQLVGLIEDGKINAIKLNNMILKDAEKEFDPGTRIGFGVDGDNVIRDNDFNNVRGSFENNSFVRNLLLESEQIKSQYDNLIARLKNLT